MKKILLIIGFTTMFSFACADGISDLRLFLQNNSGTVSANFVQTIYGSKKNQVSHGTMKISRPNKFSWEYTEDQQLIVSDGNHVYIYDKPLQQVTEKALNGSLGKSPALLLAGGSNIDNYYTITNLADLNGLEQVSLTPKNVNDNNGFQSVIMGFNKTTHVLTQMKFVDSFGNKSMITFSNLKTQVKFPDSVFKFSAPKGVDVVSALQ